MNPGFPVVLWSWLDSHIWRLGPVDGPRRVSLHMCCPPACSGNMVQRQRDRQRSPTQQELSRLLPASRLLTAPCRPCRWLSLGSVLGGGGNMAMEGPWVIATLELYHSRSLFWLADMDLPTPLPPQGELGLMQVGLGGGSPCPQDSLRGTKHFHGPE